MPSSTSSDRLDVRRPDRGQAAVELALAIPLVVVLVLGIVQVAIVGVRQVAIDAAARDGARAASVAADPGAAAREAVSTSIGLPVDVDTVAGASTVTVTVSYDDPTSVPIIGRVIGTVHLTATSTMPREPP